jgi:unsaturated rhamnogalacturonyl hydrolase
MFNKLEVFEDAARQIILIHERTLDRQTGLCRHGWDSLKEQKWAEPDTGRSPHSWGRAMGWFMAAVVDTLEYFPERHTLRDAIAKIFVALADTLLCVRDSGTKVWRQVLDAGGRQGNFFESSCSCLFVYALLKGVRLGLLDEQFRNAALESFEGIISQFIVTTNGAPVITKCCMVAGLGGKPYRDGTYEYYMTEPIISNDMKAVGMFIQAAVEVSRCGF